MHSLAGFRVLVVRISFGIHHSLLRDCFGVVIDPESLRG
jgi:hypothetical protein